MDFPSFLDSLFLTLHDLMRWVVLAAAVYALWRAYGGWLGKREWLKADQRAGLIFTIVLDTQALFGLILYFFFSDASKVALSNLGVALSDPTDRFFGLIHLVAMFAALALAHVGQARARKAPGAPAKFKRAALFFTASAVVILLAIPWEFIPAIGRPMFRLFGISF
jgi:hypothetical protein